MEKIKFGDAVYDLVPAGSNRSGEHLKLVFVWPNGTTYEQIEDSLTGCDRIEVLAESGELLEAITGYTCVDQLIKQHDVIIGSQQIEDGYDDAGEPLYTTQDIIDTVMVVVLKKPGLREEIARVAADVTATQLAIVELYEGGEI